MERKYYFISVEFAFCGYMVKGTYEEALAFGIKKLKEDFNICDKDFPTAWTEEWNEFEPETKERVHVIQRIAANSYQDLLQIYEQTTEDFLDVICSSYDFLETKGKQWVLEHRDDFYEMAF